MDGKLPKIMGYSIRTERYRYNEWRDFQTGKVQARELYDHNTDPGETVNSAGHDDRKTIVDELSRKLDETLATGRSTAQSREPRPPRKIQEPGR